MPVICVKCLGCTALHALPGNTMWHEQELCAMMRMRLTCIAWATEHCMAERTASVSSCRASGIWMVLIWLLIWGCWSSPYLQHTSPVCLLCLASLHVLFVVYVLITVFVFSHQLTYNLIHLLSSLLSQLSDLIGQVICRLQCCDCLGSCLLHPLRRLSWLQVNSYHITYYHITTYEWYDTNISHTTIFHTGTVSTWKSHLAIWDSKGR